jgi:LmbE family N-acetylglucosaminyl deacetylase
MPTALFLSPHLDDVAFSCGGLAAALAARGWRAVVATVFTCSVHPAAGFALACQLDKGLPAEVDYMALRRTEDRDAMAALGAEARWLDLPEAPHRGYDSAPALFAGVRTGDAVADAVADHLRALLRELAPALVLAPQGLGNHADHLQVIRAVHAACPAEAVVWYRDTPYSIRVPDARPGPSLAGLAEAAVPLGAAALARKLDAATAYRTQLGFQFGGAEAARAALHAFACREGGGQPAERFLAADPAILRIAALQAA